MAQTQAAIPPPSWLVDRLSHGVLARAFPLDVVRAVLDECGRSGVRRRVLPAELTVYFVIALGLYRAAPMTEIYRCLVDGLRPFGIGPPGAPRPPHQKYPTAPPPYPELSASSPLGFGARAGPGLSDNQAMLSEKAEEFIAEGVIPAGGNQDSNPDGRSPRDNPAQSSVATDASTE